MHDALLADRHRGRSPGPRARRRPHARGSRLGRDRGRGAIAAMTAAWVRARTAYEHIEGALAPLFPDLDAAIDARYDDFLDGARGAGRRQRPVR